MSSAHHLPYTVYKMDISYFSGKLEAYLRYKEIPYNAVECCEDQRHLHYVGQMTGTQKVPAIEMANGQWLFDTTPMIQWLDNQHNESSIYPSDPALRFLALLIEDYGDEWLWRPAMWWRWMPRASRVTLGRQISKILSKRLAIPLGFYFGHRQLKEWLWSDGVDKHNSHDVRDMYYRELEFLEALLEDQPFILGSHPSIADYGYFASFFRHFGNDPISAEVMRRKSSNTYEWLARLWNAKSSKFDQQTNWQWPNARYWQPLLKRIAQDYLPYLHQNAIAFREGRKRFDYAVDSLQFKKTVTTDYRVWCRQVLQREFALLERTDQRKIEALFEPVGGLNSLHTDGIIESGMDSQFNLPMDPTKLTKRPGFLRRHLGQPRN